jgi:hypothetical protein
MTGRAAGYCAGYPVPGRGFGRGGGWAAGRGRGWGRAFGWGRGFGWGPPPYSAPVYGAAYAQSYGPEDEVTVLKDQARYFEEALQELKKRIEEIESSAEKD